MRGFVVAITLAVTFCVVGGVTLKYARPLPGRWGRQRRVFGVGLLVIAGAWLLVAVVNLAVA